MTVPEMLYGGLRLADHPRATVLRSTPRRPWRCPVLHRVVTAADVPGNPYVGLIEQDWPIFVGDGGDHTVYRRRDRRRRRPTRRGWRGGRPH